MVDWERGGILWRQGQFLTEKATESFELVASGDTGLKFPIVISHDCDISNSPDCEPNIEIIVGTRIEAVDGNCTHSKNPRKLHLLAKQGDADVCLELWATDKRAISKLELLAFKPSNELTLPTKELLTLQRWLAARYYRTAFPDEFDRRFNQTGLQKALIKTLKPLGHHIIAALFDIENEENVGRKIEDLYTLTIYLLYDTASDPLVAERVAQEAAQSILEIFERCCYDTENSTWHYIELLDCHPIADTTMTYAESQSLKKWNIDHLSLRSEEEQPMLFI
ncbi:MAG: hypothetical protein F9K32_04545 [Desulfobulbaceae bacterium]|nr:MAG: hypothetical protein F9K32_04545 [Desulfobulbaceae bacterium]